MDSYFIFKTIHMSCALLSITGFLLRGYWMLQESPLLQLKPVKILPHIIDTLLLLSAFALLFVLGFGLLKQGWLVHKIGLLLVYIVLGMIALGDKYSRPKKIAAFVSAVLVFFYIVGIAVTKTALSWLFYIFF
ncbi:MAG: SirB2 family protein [Pseudohongiellaceae bacterium]